MVILYSDLILLSFKVSGPLFLLLFLKKKKRGPYVCVNLLDPKKLAEIVRCLQAAQYRG